MKIAVIGMGYWGPNIVRNALSCKAYTQVICYDQNPVQLEKIKRMFPMVLATTAIEEIADDESVQAVAIITPVDTHFPLAKMMLSHGKHILVEKPFTYTVKEAEELIQLAERKGLVIMTDHTFIFTPAVRKIKELKERGEIGDIYYYDSVRVNLGLFQRDVNVIWDLAPHDFAIMNYILGQKPVSLQAMGSDHIGKGLEDVAYVHINFENNLIAHFHLNWLSPVKIRKTLIGGTKKMVVYDDLEASEKIKVYDKGIEVKTKEEEYKALISYRSGDMHSPVLSSQEALQAVLEEFAHSILEKRKPLTSGEDGLAVVRLLEATQKSIKEQGKIIKL